MSALEIRNVSKVYPNGKAATYNANISIESGEFVVFVGPSGCGKSTLLRMIAGLESITDGEMLLADERINDLEPADRNIAMVFQNYALYPHMTVFKNLAYGLINRKYPKNEIQKELRDNLTRLTSLRNKIVHFNPSSANFDNDLFSTPDINLISKSAQIVSKLNDELSRIKLIVFPVHALAKSIFEEEFQ